MALSHAGWPVALAMTLALIMFVWGMYKYGMRIYRRFALTGDGFITGKFEIGDDDTVRRRCTQYGSHYASTYYRESTRGAPTPITLKVGHREPTPLTPALTRPMLRTTPRCPPSGKGSTSCSAARASPMAPTPAPRRPGSAPRRSRPSRTRTLTLARMASQPEPEPEPEPSACPDQVEKIIGLVEPKAPSDGTIRGIAGAAAPAPALHAHSKPVQQEACALQ